MNIYKTLFYPCCGGDTLEALTYFEDQVSNYHFSDIHKVGLPLVKGSDTRPSFVYTIEETLPVTLVSQRLEKVEKKEHVQLNRPFSSRLQSMDCYIYQEEWLFDSGRRAMIYVHLRDARDVFDDLSEISIFFYRGDSMMESGSGITWFGPDLFTQLDQKLVNEGLIITDGSNPDQHSLDTPWQQVYRHSHWNFPDLLEGEQPQGFNYGQRHYVIIGELSPRYGKTYIWQVLP